MTRIESYPRWQSAITERLYTWRVRSRGLDIEESRRREWLMSRRLGLSLSLERWDEMTFNDKVLFRKFAVRDERFKVLSDKVAFRDYAAAIVGQDRLPELLAVIEHPADLRSLVGPAILKGSHGSGMAIILESDRHLTEAELARASSWLREDFSYWSREWAYEGAARRIVVERLLDYPSPPDYKFFVFSGVPRAVQVDESRFSRHTRAIMSAEWDLLGGCHIQITPDRPSRPAQLEELVEVAARLGRGFDFIRVDLFDVDGRCFVGEMTVCPIAGRGCFHPRSLDAKLGAWWFERPDESTLIPAVLARNRSR